MRHAVAAAVEATERFLATADFSGTVRISVAGDAVLEQASGLANRADGVPIEINTRFGIASVTKAFTAVSVGRLVDRGAIAFESRVVDLLPLSSRPSRMADEVTIHHLLTHTSGISDYYDEVSLGAAAFEDVWRQIPTHTMRTPADFLPLFRDLEPLAATGGAEGRYCSAGYILLGLIIEEISGTDYIDFVRREVFEPAAMGDSAFFALDEIVERVAIGYVETDGGWKTNHFAIPIVGGPDGGAFSTVRDLNRFLDALDSGALLAPDTLASFRHPHVQLEDVGYGYGLVVSEDGGWEAFGHGGADPGFSARAFRYPDLDMNVAMLGNTIDETDPPIAVFREALSR